MLYLPWRQETEDLLGEYNTAQEALLAKKDQVVNAERSQASAIARTKLVNIFVPHANIEKVDSNKENISHFILQYEVQCDGDDGDFENFTMAIASKYIEQNIEYDLKVEELFEYIGYLKQIKC